MDAQRGAAAKFKQQAKKNSATTEQREGMVDSPGKALTDAEAFAQGLSDAALINIIVKMQNPLTGIPLKDQCWRMRSFAQCFTGREGVDWLLLHADSRITTEELALAVCSRLQAVGAFRPLSRAGHAFAMDDSLYQLKGLSALEDLHYLDELFKEYLVYRGLAETLQAFDSELAGDRLLGFQGARLTAKMLQLVHELDLDGFRGLWSHLERVLFSRLDGKYQATVTHLEAALQRHYLVTAVQKKQPGRVHEFFRDHAAALAGKVDWQKWFTLTYHPAPHKHPDFEVYFTKQWGETLSCSLTNFLTTVLQEAPLPKALLFNVERAARTSSEKEVLQLRAQVVRLQQQVSSLEADLAHEEHERERLQNPETETAVPVASAAAAEKAARVAKVAAIPTLRKLPSREASPQIAVENAPTLEVTPPSGSDQRKSSQEKVFLGKQRQSSLSADAPLELMQATVSSSQRFVGHGDRAICSLQLSAAGSLVASGSVDGTVKIWPLSDVTEEIATISCFAKVTDVAWGRGSERILLVGSKMGTARMWDVKDESLLAEMALPHAVDAICCGAATMCACISSKSDTNSNSRIFLYDVQYSPPKLCQEIAPNPPTHIHCAVINKAGTQLLAGGENGFIYSFDTATYVQTHWRAHFGPVRALCYDKQGSTVISIGKDRNLLQWNLLSTGTPQLAYSYNNASPHASISFSPFGEFFLTNENESVVVYKLSAPMPMQILPQGSTVARVAWHPTANICLAGTEEGHVQVMHLKLAK